jgi:hypothetical protein
MTDIATLIARLEKLEGPDSDIDGDIWCEIFAPDVVAIDFGIQFPAVTASLDAAIALAERVLPGAEFNLTNIYGVAVAEIPINDSDSPFETGRHAGGILPIALLIAILRALQGRAHQEPDHEGK